MHACNQPGRLRKWLPSCTVTDLILVYSARLPSIKSQPERIVRLLDRASVRRLKDTCSNLPDAVVMQAPTPSPDRFLRFISPASSHIMCRKAAQSLEVIQSSSEKRRKKRKKKLSSWRALALLCCLLCCNFGLHLPSREENHFIPSLLQSSLSLLTI